MSRPDVDLLARMTDGLYQCAEALTAINNTKADPYIRAPLLALRRVVADLRLALDPPPPSEQ